MNFNGETKVDAAIISEEFNTLIYYNIPQNSNEVTIIYIVYTKSGSQILQSMYLKPPTTNVGVAGIRYNPKVPR